jgi:hypothetical protein
MNPASPSWDIIETFECDRVEPLDGSDGGEEKINQYSLLEHLGKGSTRFYNNDSADFAMINVQ